MALTGKHGRGTWWLAGALMLVPWGGAQGDPLVRPQEPAPVRPTEAPEVPKPPEAPAAGEGSAQVGELGEPAPAASASGEKAQAPPPEVVGPPPPPAPAGGTPLPYPSVDAAPAASAAPVAIAVPPTAAPAEAPATTLPTDPAPAAALESSAPTLPPYAPAYRNFAGSTELLESWARAAPRHCSLLEVGRELDGRALMALQLGAPGGVALEQRPTIFLIGGLDGVSLCGSEAVLACVQHLLVEPVRMPEGVTFVALPQASPQALEAALAGRGHDGRNLRPMDDDRDGMVDEDVANDLDGNNQIWSMLVAAQDGPWARRGDPRFLAPAQPGDQPLYQLTTEGADEDGDGRFNEDPAGGVVLDRNFPVNRTGGWRQTLAGPWPMSEPLTRAVADLVLARRTVAVVLLQGNHGMLATPGGLGVGQGLALPLESDLPVYRRLTELFAHSTARPQSEVVRLGQARGCDVPGSALDWLYVVPGALALELAPWGPRVELGRQTVARDARFAGDVLQEPPPRTGALRRLPLPLEARPEWAPWVDNVLGGLGFMSWQPVQLDGGREGLVGGWEPLTVQNPPEEALERAFHGVPEFVAELAAGLPRLEVQDIVQKGRGEVHRVSLRVRNSGQLPSGLDRSLAAGEPEGVVLELALPAGAQLLAGEPRVVLPRLLSGELSREVGWLVLAPAGTVASVSVSSSWTLPRVTRLRL